VGTFPVYSFTGLRIFEAQARLDLLYLKITSGFQNQGVWVPTAFGIRFPQQFFRLFFVDKNGQNKGIPEKIGYNISNSTSLVKGKA